MKSLSSELLASDDNLHKRREYSQVEQKCWEHYEQVMKFNKKCGLLAEAVRYYVETQHLGNAVVTFTQLLTTYDESAGYAEAESSRQGDMTEWLAHVIATVVRSVEQTPDLHRQMMQGVQTVRNKRAAKILTHTLKGESIFSRSLKKLF